MTGRLHIGTSGFAFDVWKGSFYPERIRPREMLPFYATRFGSVELNATFRRDQTESTLDTWRDGTPDGFVFAVKAHQRITHFRRLGDVTESLPSFIGQVRRLEPKLGPILFQCPPNLRFDRALIDRFLGGLPSDVRAVFEFRHPSWEEARPMVREAGAAWCESETDEAAFAGNGLEGMPFGYLRLRRGDYSEADLQTWARRISDVLSHDRDVYCYFKHEEGDVGPKFATLLRRMVEPQS